jgi:NADPH:quinone reductase
MVMKALLYNLETDTFSVNENVPIPEPEEDEIRVKVLATALNPVDAKISTWKFILPPGTTNTVIGLDVCGLVDKIGSAVTTVAVGDYVLYHGRMRKGNGGFAEYAIHDALTTVVLGKTLPMDAVMLAATPCAAWTAHRALFDKLLLPRIGSTPPLVNTSEGEVEPSLAVVGASGGVGSFAIQLAALAGLKTIVAVCSNKHEQHVRSLGATHYVDYKADSIHNGLQLATGGEGVNRILDCVGSDTTKDAIQSLAFDGLVCPIVSTVEGDLQGIV